MTPEQIKAKGDELIEKFEDDCKCAYSDSGYYTFSTSVMNKHATQCAIIAVEEIIEHMKQDDLLSNDCHNANSRWIPYYSEVINYLKSKI